MSHLTTTLSSWKNSRLFRFYKNWALPISMVAGVAAYFLFVGLPLSNEVHWAANRLIAFLQPALIFVMLFLSFCKVDVRQMRLRRWHLYLALIQAGGFVLPSLLIYFGHIEGHAQVLMESAMLCLICPTATAAMVVTDKLGGNVTGIVTYTMLSNVVTASVSSLCIPLINPQADLNFLQAFAAMMSKVFSLLVVPLVLALLVRRFLPSIHRRVVALKDLAFYIWTVALALALAITTRSIVHSQVPVLFIVGIGLVSMVCCVLQFALGRLIGRRYGERITAGQSLGQKNTIFIIWLSYTYMNPVTAVAGGLYSIWHNLINSWQLYEKRREEELGRQSVL